MARVCEAMKLKKNVLTELGWNSNVELAAPSAFAGCKIENFVNFPVFITVVGYSLNFGITLLFSVLFGELDVMLCSSSRLKASATWLLLPMTWRMSVVDCNMSFTRRSLRGVKYLVLVVNM